MDAKFVLGRAFLLSDGDDYRLTEYQHLQMMLFHAAPPKSYSIAVPLRVSAYVILESWHRLLITATPTYPIGVAVFTCLPAIRNEIFVQGHTIFPNNNVTIIWFSEVDILKMLQNDPVSQFTPSWVAFAQLVSNGERQSVCLIDDYSQFIVNKQVFLSRLE